MQKIEFIYELDFHLELEDQYRTWVVEVVNSEKYTVGSIVYIFCDDNYLLKLHQEYLNEQDYTDIITFDYVNGREISGDIFISIDRVKDNAEAYKCDFKQELARVMSHGLLHLMGYHDKEDKDRAIMRDKEEEKIKMFHVEQ